MIDFVSSPMMRWVILSLSLSLSLSLTLSLSLFFSLFLSLSLSLSLSLCTWKLFSREKRSVREIQQLRLKNNEQLDVINQQAKEIEDFKKAIVVITGKWVPANFRLPRS